MRKAMKILLMLLLCCGSGCSFNNMQSDINIIGGEEFKKLYFKVRTPVYHLDYVGIVEGYHQLDIYDLGYESLVSYRGSYRARIEDLPDDFPAEDQPRIVDDRDPSDAIPPE